MKYLNHIYIFLILIIGACFSGCTVDDQQQLPDRNYQLVWSDEFDADAGTSPDPTKWTYDIGQGQNGWGNGEFQYYTSRPENVAHDGEGNLIITLRNEAFGGANFSSARIKTQGLYAHQYGRVEARLKTPFGPGIWPAFWMLGENISEVSWPQCGEIDIMELRGQEPNIIHGSIHGPGYSAGNAVTSSLAKTDGRFDTDYHLFAIEWGKDYIDFFVDEKWYNRITPEDANGQWVYDQPFFFIFNIAVGGNFVGFPTADTPYPQEMIIDYIRAYQEI